MQCQTHSYSQSVKHECYCDNAVADRNYGPRTMLMVWSVGLTKNRRLELGAASNTEVSAWPTSRGGQQKPLAWPAGMLLTRMMVS